MNDFSVLDEIHMDEFLEAVNQVANQFTSLVNTTGIDRSNKVAAVVHGCQTKARSKNMAALDSPSLKDRELQSQL